MPIGTILAILIQAEYYIYKINQINKYLNKYTKNMQILPILFIWITFAVI